MDLAELSVKRPVLVTVFSIIIILFGLIGCMSISPTPFSGPSGKQAYSMMCSGMGRTIDACFQKAGEMCSNGYNIIDRSSGTAGFMSQGRLMMAPREQLAIECK